MVLLIAVVVFVFLSVLTAIMTYFGGSKKIKPSTFSPPKKEDGSDICETYKISDIRSGKMYKARIVGVDGKFIADPRPVVDEKLGIIFDVTRKDGKIIATWNLDEKSIEFNYPAIKWPTNFFLCKVKDKSEVTE